MKNTLETIIYVILGGYSIFKVVTAGDFEPAITFIGVSFLMKLLMIKI